MSWMVVKVDYCDHAARGLLAKGVGTDAGVPARGAAEAHFMGPASKRRLLDILEDPTCVCRQLVR